jgi:hypothetical protein
MAAETARLAAPSQGAEGRPKPRGQTPAHIPARQAGIEGDEALTGKEIQAGGMEEGQGPSVIALGRRPLRLGKEGGAGKPGRPRLGLGEEGGGSAAKPSGRETEEDKAGA